MRLTAAQINTLKHMANGAIVYWSTGLDAYAHWPAGIQARNPNWRTMFRLEDEKLVAKCDEKWTGWIWRITPAGRAALKAQGDVK